MKMSGDQNDKVTNQPCPACSYYGTEVYKMCEACHRAWQESLPTIEQMSGLIKDFTRGKPMKEYMEELSDE
jgi:hypothetical protein